MARREPNVRWLQYRLAAELSVMRRWWYQRAISVHLVVPPASRHTGGVNAVFSDGSVHFVSNSIDTGNLNARQTVSGPSVYGVWGALGSKNGGEIASLPQ